MNTIMLTIGTIVVAVLVALFAVPPLVDWNSYRGVFEEEVSRVLGREVRVGGDVTLRLLPQPYVQFEKVVVADAPGVIGEPLLRAERFTLQLAVPPLLNGIFEAREITIEQPRLRLRLDENGRGNWQNIAMSSPSLGLTPTAVSLQHVRLTDAEIAVEGPDGAVLGRIGDIAGELSAGRLNGPYKFQGTARLAGDLREVRVSTGTWAAATGSTDVKLIVRSQDGATTIGLDGIVSSRDDEAVRFEGELTATSPAFEAPSAAAGPGASEASQKAEPRAPIEVKAKIAMDTQRLRLTDLVLSFDEAGRPQLMLGSAQADLGASPRVDVSLTSQWLDLDRISGVGGRAAVSNVARAFTGRLVDLASRAVGATRLKLHVEQATLAGSAVAGLSLDAEVAGPMLRVRRLAGLGPGGAAVRIDGRLPLVEGAAASFDGHLIAEGGNLSRFADWIAPGVVDPGSGRTRAFTLEGDLRVADDTIGFENASARVDGATISGALRASLAVDGAIALELAGPDIDVSVIGPDVLSAPRLRELAGLGRRDGTSRSGRPLDISITAGRLHDGDRSYRDVRFVGRSRNSELTVEELDLTTTGGLTLEAQGRIDLASPATPLRGKLVGRLVARSAAAGSDLAHFLTDVAGVPAALVAQRLPGPVDMAYVLSLGTDEASSNGGMRLSVDGTLSGDVLTAALESTGDIGSLTDRPMRVEARLATRDAARIIGWLRGSTAVPPAPLPAEAGSAAPTRLAVVASGTPASGLATNVTLSDGSDRIEVTGTTVLAADLTTTFTGQAEVAATSAGRLARLAGFARPGLLAGSRMIAFARIATTDTAVSLQLDRLQLGDTTASGRLEIARAVSDSGELPISGKLDVDAIRLSDLVELLTERSGPSGATAIASQTGDGGDRASGDPSAVPWSSQRFDAAVLAGAGIDVAVTVGRIELPQGTKLTDATLKLAAHENAISVADMAARGPLEASVAASMRLAAGSAGFRLTGDVAATGISFAALKPADASGGFAEGRADLNVSIEGEGLSPRAVMALMRGSGKITLAEGRVTGVAPAAVAAAAEKAIRRDDLGTATLQADLDETLPAAALTIPATTLDVTIKDGAVAIAPFTVTSPAGRAEVTVTVGLERLVADGRWRIVPSAQSTPTGGGASRGELPALEIVYAGPLVDLASLSPRLEAGALLRELMVRRMEGNVAELERLRKEDEARARREAELRRQREAEERQALERQLEIERQRQLLPGWGAPPVIRQPLPPPGSGQRSGAAPIDVPPTDFASVSPLMRLGAQTDPLAVKALVAANGARPAAFRDRRTRAQSKPRRIKASGAVAVDWRRAVFQR